MRILFVASESYPLVKTGGLGDVAYSLPHALQEQGADVRMLLPGYRELLQELDEVRILGWLHIQGSGRSHDVRVLEATHPAFSVKLLIADCQELYDRPGSPYLHPDGYDWPDNAERYTVFSRLAAMLSMDLLGLDWRAEVVHCHDWQTGLVPAFLASEPDRPRTVFTIHNLAYGGHFPHDEFMKLHLPGYWWSGEGVEFYGGFSMLKAGLVYADSITTVSPTYADEICTAQFGYGMQGVLQANRHKLTGILNGIDTQLWNPSIDPYIKAHYNAARRNPGKRINKQALLKSFSVEAGDEFLEKPLIGMVCRFVEQKGIDLVAEAIPTLMKETQASFVIIGAGDHVHEERLLKLQKQYPDRLFVYIGYSEELAHLVEAGADMFLMPSRFEPCGLNQMYSLHYGTPPIVNHTGGLADTVVDTAPKTLNAQTANGFVMQEPSVTALIDAVLRAIDVYANKRSWAKLLRTGMQSDLGWKNSALRYLDLYQHLLA
ncbi:starch synthase [Solemya velum gill symbiont]|uniref:glycogen synthase GlgA n=1 Tax=Solemya velum gill symbiont TaxID=2340 RepID=UPI000997463A|nr:glycogen synthase GlgA [Solemya velum gill symbiont]OOZ18393.1 starch synthase [Solemya velum gill symbiont]OOZ27917.1 starch synthase [Solemya velum gill symbiont]